MTMMDDVRRRLPAEIAGQLSADEREELARRLEVQDRLATRLRVLPLGEEEPSLAVSLERER
jgi:anti-sigma factor RsiW